MITLAWFLRESHKAVSCGILWYLVAIFPVLNLTLLNAPLMEHWLYLPLVGLMLASVALLTSLADRLGQKRAAALGLALVALLLATRTTARNNEWKDLVKLFEKDVKTYPGDSLAWFWLAKAYKERGLLANAIPAFRAGLTINPNFAKGWVEVGEALSLTGHDNEAEEALSRAVFIEPQNMWSHYLLGTHLLKQGKYQGATEALKRSIAIRPIPGAYHALGSAYLRRGQNKEAEEAFASALAIHPAGSNYHADVHVNLGRLYFRAGKRKEARAEFELALRFNPKMSIAKKLIADLDKTPPSSNRSQ
jgi:tetratricopeptide (TPR) repeat protein